MPVQTAPGPTGGDMLRSFGLIRRDPLRFLQQLQREHGDAVQLPIPRPGVYLISDPDSVKSILVTQAKEYSKRTLQYDTLALVTGNGLLTADDPPWKQRRRALQPAFHRESLSAVCDQMSAATDRVMTQWRDGDVLDIEPAMMRLSLEVVASALFGADWSSQASSLTSSTVVALNAVVARARNPLSPPLSVPTRGNLRLRAAIRTLDRAVDDLLSERLRSRSTQPDLIGLLLANWQSGDPSFDLRAVRDELVTFLIAGHETVASALTWALHLIAHDDVTGKRLGIQSDQVLGLSGLPQFEDVPRLTLARGVLDETLRLYPPAWVITRKALSERRIPYAGTVIPAGALVIISPWIVHRNPAIWPDPDVFFPDRFTDRQSAPSELYFPFGAGPRLCIGRDMALLEGTVALAALTSRFEFSHAGTDQVAEDAMVTLRPKDGLRLRLKARAAS